MNDALYMQRCLELAQLGKGLVAPNPMVGAVLVHNDNIIGEGWHRKYGEAHAEVNCLKSVSDKNKALIPESTMYVSLEPCAHTGKTPPCATRLVQGKVKKVVIANTDPFKEVSGKGIDILRGAGIEVVAGILEQQASWVNRRFLCCHTKQRPYIILKWAQSADGYIAPADGSRKQLSNTHTQQLVHKWRTEEQAIMVGKNTATNDNPQLNARLWQGNNPVRIVTDRNLSLSQDLHLFSDGEPTIVLNEVKETQEGSVQYLKCSFDKDFINEFLNILYTRNIQSVIIEGGAKLLNSFIEADAWDEARVFTAPVSLGEGIAAPALKNAEKVSAENIVDDELLLYLNRNSTFTYASGFML